MIYFWECAHCGWVYGQHAVPEHSAEETTTNRIFGAIATEHSKFQTLNRQGKKQFETDLLLARISQPVIYSDLRHTAQHPYPAPMMTLSTSDLDTRWGDPRKNISSHSNYM